jgi:uncharacterized protein (TIGR02145 family)
MLTPYLRKLDTASLSNRINNAGLPTTGNATGNIMYWDGSAWVRLPAGSNGQILQINGGMLGWANPDFICGVSRLWDFDGNTYNTVAIGSQCWIKENLKVSKYNDGTSIPMNNTYTSGTVSTEWEGLRSGAYTIYGNEASSGANATNYGFLYNWYAVKGIITVGGTSTKNICPIGWHAPTESDLNKLVKFIDSGADTTINAVFSVPQSGSAGTKLKKNDALWITNTGTDDYGFSALPGGNRNWNGSFSTIGYHAYLWSATENDSSSAFSRVLYNLHGNVERHPYNKSFGASVRCLKD